MQTDRQTDKTHVELYNLHAMPHACNQHFKKIINGSQLGRPDVCLDLEKYLFRCLHNCCVSTVIESKTYIINNNFGNIDISFRWNRKFESMNYGNEYWKRTK